MIVPFPKDPIMITTAFEVFNGTRESLLIFVPLVMLVRTLLNMVTFKGNVFYLNILTDTVLFFIGMYCLESLMALIIEIPSHAGELISKKDPVVLDKVPDKFYWFNLAIGLNDFIDYLTGFVFHLLSIIYLMLMSLAIMLGGYIIFFATLFQVRKAFTVFIMLNVFLSLWPFVWYSLDRTFEHILKVQNQNGSAMGTVVTMFVLALMKILIPILGFFGALKTPIGILGAAKMAVKNGLAPVGSALGFGLNATKKVGSTFGADKTLSYLSAPSRKRISSGIKSSKKNLENSMPFVSYKIASHLGKEHAQKGFANYKQHMQKTTYGAEGSSNPDLGPAPSTTQINDRGKSSKRVPKHLRIRKRDYIPENEFKSLHSFVKEHGIENINQYPGSSTKQGRQAITDYKLYRHNIKVRKARNLPPSSFF